MLKVFSLERANMKALLGRNVDCSQRGFLFVFPWFQLKTSVRAQYNMSWFSVRPFHRPPPVVIGAHHRRRHRLVLTECWCPCTDTAGLTWLFCTVKTAPHSNSPTEFLVQNIRLCFQTVFRQSNVCHRVTYTHAPHTRAFMYYRAYEPKQYSGGFIYNSRWRVGNGDLELVFQVWKV